APQVEYRAAARVQCRAVGLGRACDVAAAIPVDDAVAVVIDRSRFAQALGAADSVGAGVRLDADVAARSAVSGAFGCAVRVGRAAELRVAGADSARAELAGRRVARQRRGQALRLAAQVESDLQ